MNISVNNPVCAAPVMHFSTDMFAPHERASAWCEAYGQTIAKLEVDPHADSPFRAEATLSTLPGLAIVSTQTGQMKWRCRFHADDLALVIVESGAWACAQRGREVMLQSGEATLCTNDEAMLGSAAGRRSIISIPLKAIRPLIGAGRLNLLSPIAADTAPLALLAPYLRSLRDGVTSPDIQRLVVSHVHDLMALLAGATRDGTEVAAGRGVRAARLTAIKQDVARNLADGDISVGAIALRHRVTPRYIQMLFENEGTTLTEHVRGVRLASAYRMLSDTRYAREKVSTIAYDCGFGDLSHFHRLFRRRYGLSASDVRAAARAN
jgi:AraC-like DNA-binding protein